MSDDVDLSEIINDAKGQIPIGQLWLATSFCGETSGRVCYCNERNSWMLFTGKRWETAKEYQIFPVLDDVLKERIKSKDKKIVKLAKKTASSANDMTAVLKLAKGYCNKSVHMFDCHPYKLNLSNGVLDLKSDRFETIHDPSYLITRMTDVQYVPGAKCPNWTAFLEKIFMGDQDLIEYAQILVGYSLIESSEQQFMVVMYGNGQNGKSTFINVVEKILGEYCKKTTPQILRESKSTATNELAGLKGMRFISTIETKEDCELDEQAVKMMTGDEKISCRFLYGEFFEYMPEFKIFMATNHKPRIKGTDLGIWRRIKLVPFEYTFTNEEKIPRFYEKYIYPEISGVLNWAITGWMKYQAAGIIKDPKVVRDATAEYRAEQDDFQQFIDDFCVIAPYASVNSSRLLEIYREKMKDSGYSHRRLAENLRRKKFAVEHGRNGNIWRGIGVRSDE